MNESLQTNHFSINDFRAELARAGLNQKELAKELGIGETTLVKKLKVDGFTAKEIRKMVNLFGKKETLDFMFKED